MDFNNQFMFPVTLFFFTCFSCDSIAGCTGALLVESLNSEAEVTTAHQRWHTAHPFGRWVTLKHLDIIPAVCHHDDVALGTSRLFVHHPGWVCQAVNLHVKQVRYAGSWRFITSRILAVLPFTHFTLDRNGDIFLFHIYWVKN